MATHSSILAQKIPWTEEPGRLQSMGSQRFRHDLATKQHHQYKLLVVACRISFLDQEWNLDHLHWEQRVLATGPPGKSQMDVGKVGKKSPLPQPPGLWRGGDKHQTCLRSSKTLVYSALSLCSFHFPKKSSSLEIESKIHMSDRPRGECWFCIVFLSCISLANDLTSPSLSFPICEVGAIPPEKGRG